MIRLFFLVALLTFGSVTYVSAQTTIENTSNAQLLVQIDQLLKQIQTLQAELNARVAIESGNLETKKDFSSFIIDDESTVKARYQIRSVDDVTFISNTIHRNYLSKLFSLLPDNYDGYIDEFLVFKDRKSTVDAFVETIPPYRINTWRFGLSEEMFNFSVNSNIIEDLFIHEMAHIFSYDSIPGIAEPATARCHVYYTEYGCPPANSYLMAFTNAFWTSDDLYDLIDADTDSIWSTRELERGFVSEYAGTNPQEDFAESFVRFVIDTKPNGTLIKDKKVRFFYQYKEMLDLREEILSAQ